MVIGPSTQSCSRKNSAKQTHLLNVTRSERRLSPLESYRQPLEQERCFSGILGNCTVVMRLYRSTALVQRPLVPRA